MKHRMAVGAYGSQVIDGVDFILGTYGRQLHDVVHVDEADADVPVLHLEIHAAD